MSEPNETIPDTVAASEKTLKHLNDEIAELEAWLGERKKARAQLARNIETLKALGEDPFGSGRKRRRR